MKAHDDYKQLEVPSPGPALYDCPVCGSKASLWQYSTSETDATTKAVMCTMGEAFGPQDAIVNEGCLLYMPPGVFHKATMRDAIKFWNSYAVALMKLQRANRWKSAQILRDNGGSVLSSAAAGHPVEASAGSPNIGSVHAPDAGDRASSEAPAEVVRWLLEYTFDGEEKGSAVYESETECRASAERDGGVCVPLVRGRASSEAAPTGGFNKEARERLGVSAFNVMDEIKTRDDLIAFARAWHEEECAAVKGSVRASRCC